jgi:hypothetical protein
MRALLARTRPVPIVIAAMSLGEFLARLQESGCVRVVRDEAGPRPGDVERVLREVDAATRLELADGLPALDLPAAVWGVALLYQGCAALTYRDLDAAAVARRLGRACPSSGDAPATHYSVDLALRALPDLFDLARGLAAADPLLGDLRRVGQQWPLSSVGCEGIGGVDAAPLLAAPGLCLLYVDRILRRDDATRLADPHVARAVAAALSGHPELAPAAVARALAHVVPMEVGHA